MDEIRVTCKWCGEPAETSVHVTDISVQPRREYKEYLCNACYRHQSRVLEYLERKYGCAYNAHIKRLMRRWLKKRQGAA